MAVKMKVLLSLLNILVFQYLIMTILKLLKLFKNGVYWYHVDIYHKNL